MQSNSLNLTFKRILQVDPLKVDTNKLVSFLIQKTVDHLQLTVHTEQYEYEYITVYRRVAEPEPMEPKLFEIWSRSRNYLISKYLQ